MKTKIQKANSKARIKATCIQAKKIYTKEDNKERNRKVKINQK